MSAWIILGGKCGEEKLNKKNVIDHVNFLENKFSVNFSKIFKTNFFKFYYHNLEFVVNLCYIKIL